MSGIFVTINVYTTEPTSSRIGVPSFLPASIKIIKNAVVPKQNSQLKTLEKIYLLLYFFVFFVIFFTPQQLFVLLDKFYVVMIFARYLFSKLLDFLAKLFDLCAFRAFFHVRSGLESLTSGVVRGKLFS